MLEDLVPNGAYISVLAARKLRITTKLCSSVVQSIFILLVMLNRSGEDRMLDHLGEALRRDLVKQVL